MKKEDIVRLLEKRILNSTTLGDIVYPNNKDIACSMYRARKIGLKSDNGKYKMQGGVFLLVRDALKLISVNDFFEVGSRPYRFLDVIFSVEEIRDSFNADLKSRFFDNRKFISSPKEAEELKKEVFRFLKD